MNKITTCKEKFNQFKSIFFLLSFLLLQSIGVAQNEEVVTDTTQEAETAPTEKKRPKLQLVVKT